MIKDLFEGIKPISVTRIKFRRSKDVARFIARKLKSECR